MNKPLTIAITAVAVTGAVAARAMIVSYKDLYERFPQIDKKITRKAYNKFLKDAFLGELDLAGKTDNDMDYIFLGYVYELEPKAQ